MNNNNNNQDLQSLILMLQQENAALKKAVVNKSNKQGIKVSEKGAVSVYGLQRFPITLYKAQWVKLLAMAEDIKKFIADNESVLTEKE